MATDLHRMNTDQTRTTSLFGGGYVARVARRSGATLADDFGDFFVSAGDDFDVGPGLGWRDGFWLFFWFWFR